MSQDPGSPAAIEVDATLAQRLIGSQFPGIALGSFSQLGEGWDNVCWLVNSEVVFRFPRRASAVPRVQREMAVLGCLARHLPLPIPRPGFLGAADPDAGYPWPFFGAPLLAGTESWAAGLDDRARASLGGPLGLFLKALHSAEVAAAVTDVCPLPEDPSGRADMGRRVARTRAALGDVQRLGLWKPSSFVLDQLVSARALPAPQATGLVHSDLHFRHLLIDDHAGIGGVIDWDDLCLGHPCIDLQVLWSFLPPPGRREFVDAYGPVGEENLLRARVLAFSLNALLAIHGHSTGHAGIEREAVASLVRAATS